MLESACGHAEHGRADSGPRGRRGSAVKAPHGTPAPTRSWSSVNACGVAVNHGVLLCVLPKVIMGGAKRPSTTSLCFDSCHVVHAFPFGPKRLKCVDLVYTLAVWPLSTNVPCLVLTWVQSQSPSVTLCPAGVEQCSLRKCTRNGRQSRIAGVETPKLWESPEMTSELPTTEFKERVRDACV